eukprot:29885-Prorocentrum_minimum.AAC.1
MIAKSVTMRDSSGKGNHAMGCSSIASGTLNCPVDAKMYFRYLPTPTMPPCPQMSFPNVVHVDGGAEIEIAGIGFARSQWLKCSFSMSDGTVRVMKAEFTNNEHIKCASPGSPDQTVSALE